MPLPFELTAENVVKYARENGIIIKRECIADDYPRLCARATIVYAANPYMDERYVPIYGRKAESLTGLTHHQLEAIEYGFEQFDETPSSVDVNDPYYKMGQEIWLLSQSRGNE